MLEREVAGREGAAVLAAREVLAPGVRGEHLGRSAAERAVTGDEPGESGCDERRLLVRHPVLAEDPADAARARSASSAVPRQVRIAISPTWSASAAWRWPGALDSGVISSISPGISGSPSRLYDGSCGIARLPLAGHVADHRDRADRLVLALQPPRGDGGVVHGPVEREVHLDVPLEAASRRQARSVLASCGESETTFASTFQCPGGVSELGPSAQNSASTRA